MSAPVLFQFLPPLLPSEYQALTESIQFLVISGLPAESQMVAA